jgi:hypothetical protein
MKLFFCLFVFAVLVLGFEFMASALLISSYSTTSATLPVLFAQLFWRWGLTFCHDWPGLRSFYLYFFLVAMMTGEPSRPAFFQCGVGPMSFFVRIGLRQ